MQTIQAIRVYSRRNPNRSYIPDAINLRSAIDTLARARLRVMRFDAHVPSRCFISLPSDRRRFCRTPAYRLITDLEKATCARSSRLVRHFVPHSPIDNRELIDLFLCQFSFANEARVRYTFNNKGNKTDRRRNLDHVQIRLFPHLISREYASLIYR